ncbi:MAG: hypothetical protein KBG58_04400 [Giesbergeria sp.]|nr:hypothetical protein [Giesbergeria sp.]MBP6322136.1 hypothetical protein [Giesbergeria sp.]MBP6374975.1 hypothetical protein [Giesbergeria sp.]MBP8839880.1 hypothetical protein [Giesbergeria sp.]
MHSKAPLLTYRVAAVFALLLLGGCEIPGLIPDPRVVQREADAKAVGGACRHALRGIEDCYTLNPKAPKSAIFAGWKDMDVYMRENKIDGAPSMLGKADKPARAPRSDASDTSDADRS